MALEKHRKSSFELQMEAKVGNLTSALLMLTTTLSQALPTIPNLDYITNNSFGSCPDYFALNGEALLLGRGPRFISRYNLAESDEERQKLLDSLPKLEAPQLPSYLRLVDYFREYRLNLTKYTDHNNRPSMAREWKDYYATLEDSCEVFEGTLEEYAETLSVGSTPNDDAKCVKFKIGGKEQKFLLLPMAGIQGYHVVEFVHMHGNGPTEMQPHSYATIRWAPYENCWAMLNGLRCSDQDFATALERLALTLGFPAYVPVSPEEMKLSFDNLAEKINAAWLPMVETDFAGEMRITVQDLATLSIKVPRKDHYSEYEFELIPHDSGDDLDEYTKFKVAHDWRPSYSGEGVKSLIPEIRDLTYIRIPHRQWARLTGMLNAIVAHPVPELEFIPRVD